MTRFILLLIILCALPGCAGLHDLESGLGNRFSLGKVLDKATSHIENGNNKEASKLLESIVTGPAVPGITDEALFRLSILTLNPALDKDSLFTSRSLLTRLVKEYPASPWTRQVQPLYEYLTINEDLQKQNRNLKILNLSLTKDNKELKSSNQNLTRENRDLHQSIEKIKNLDIELEKKTR